MTKRNYRILWGFALYGAYTFGRKVENAMYRSLMSTQYGNNHHVDYSKPPVAK